MSPTRTSVAALAALGACLVVSPARADQDDVARRRAEESYRGAQAAVARKDFVTAAAAFESAASFVPHPAALLAASDAWERAGEPARAAEDCDRALALPNLKVAVAKDNIDYARDARDCVQRLAPKLATIEVTGPVRFAVSVDGGAREPVPTQRRVRPGRHELVFTDLTSSETRAVDVTVGVREVRKVDAELPTIPTAPPPLPSAAPSAPAASPSSPAAPSAPPAADQGTSATGGPPTASWIAFGVAGLGAIASSVFTVQLVDAQHAYQSHPTQAGRDDFYRNVALTDVALGVTAAAAITGVVLWVTAPTSSNKSAQAFRTSISF